MSSPAVLIYDNFADNATLSGGSYTASLPLTNVQTEDIEEVAQTADAQNASTKFSLDFGDLRPIGGVVVGPINMTPGATWRVRSYADAAHTTVKYDSGVLTVPGSTVDWSDTNDWLEWEDPGFWYGIEASYNLPQVPTYIANIIPVASASAALAQYWLVEFFDTENADGKLRFGRLLFGRAWRPSANYSAGNSFTFAPLGKFVESLGGKRVFWNRGTRRVVHLPFSLLTQEELFDDVFRIQSIVGTDQQVFVVPDPDDSTNFVKRSFLATLTNPPPIVQELAISSIGSTVIDAEEVL